MSEKIHFSLDAGSCHMGSLGLALELVDAAADAGADSIKFQFGVKPPNIALPPEYWPKICHRAKQKKIAVFASCFSRDAFNWYLRQHPGDKIVKFAFSMRNETGWMREAKAKRFKVVASCDEMSDRELSSVADVKLKCIPDYPLQYMPHFYDRCFERFEGWSDHSLGIVVALRAASLGAKWIEKHLRLEQSVCPDACFALLPEEAKMLAGALK